MAATKEDGLQLSSRMRFFVKMTLSMGSQWTINVWQGTCISSPCSGGQERTGSPLLCNHQSQCRISVPLSINACEKCVIITSIITPNSEFRFNSISDVKYRRPTDGH